MKQWKAFPWSEPMTLQQASEVCEDPTSHSRDDLMLALVTFRRELDTRESQAYEDRLGRETGRGSSDAWAKWKAARSYAPTAGTGVQT